MRMKVCKRIGALVLALALILSGVPQMAIEALAETTGNEFSITGLSNGTFIQSNGYWRILLKYTGTFDTGGIDAAGDFTTWMSYIINDEIQDSAYGVQFYQATDVTTDGTIALHIPPDVVPSDGSADLKFVIKARTWNNVDNNGDGTPHSYTMTSDLVLYFNEYGIFFGEEKIVKEELQNVYITEIGQSYRRDYIYPKMSAEDAFVAGDKPMAAVGDIEDAWYYPDSENGIWLDGRWMHGAATTPDGSIEFMKATDWPGRWRLHPAWYFDGGTNKSNQPIAYGERITLKGLFVAGEKSFNVQNSVIEWHADTGVGTSSSTGTWIVLPRLLELQEGTTVNNGRWEIHMSHVGELVGATDETFTGKAVVGDEEIDVTISTDGTNIIITPPADKVPADGTTVTMTLKAGDITGSARSKSMIVNDVTFYINQHGLSLDAPIPETEEEYITKIHDIPATNSSSVYFEMSAVDAFGEQMIVGDEADIKPHAMSGVMDGAYYHESGVWIGDTRYAVDSGESPRLVKSDAIRDGNQKDYYIPFWSVSSKIVDGVKVRVKGLFGADGKFANIAESVMQYNATEDDWILLPRLLGMAKGAEKVDNQWKIYMNYVGTLTGQEGEKFTATAYKEDDTTCKVTVYVEGDYLVLVPEADAFPIDGESVITLKAGDIIGDKESKSYIVNDVTLCANKYGVSLDELIPSYTIVENKLDPMTTYKEETEGSYVWDIYMKQSGSFLGEEGEVFEWPATIAGEDGRVDVYAKNVNGIIYFNPVIPDSDVLKPANGKVEVVLKATTVTGTKETQNELKEAVTLYFDRNGLSVDDSTLEDFEVPEESIKFTLTSPYTWDTGIYFNVSGGDDIVGDSSWEVKPTAIGGYKNGVCYRGDSGVYITDPEGKTTKFSPNSSLRKIPTFIKIGNSGTNTMVYYLGINSSHAVETGTKVEIKGLFEWQGAYVDVASIVLEWSGAEWINVTPAHDKDVQFTLTGSTGTSKRIYVNAVDGFDPNISAFIDPMPGEENGVFVNGIRTKAQIYKIGTPYSTGTYHILLDGQNIEAQVGDEVIVKGRFISMGYIVEYKEVCWVFNGSKWVNSTVPLKVNLADANQDESKTSFGFTTNIADTLPVNEERSYTFTAGGIYIKGIYNAAAQLYKLDGYYKVDLSTCNHVFAVGDTVTVDGTVEHNDITVEYMRTVFTYQGNGEWKLTESGIPKQPVRFELNAEESCKDKETGVWKLLFTAVDGLRGDPGVEADATYTGLVALVEGGLETNLTFFKNSKSYYEVTIPRGALPTTGDTYKIVIKRGTITGGWESKAGRYMQKELILYVKGDRISDKGTPVITENVSLSYSSGSAKEINLLLNGEDAMITTTKEGGTIYAEDEPNSGVFINGVKQSNIGIFKFVDQDGKTYYYVPFDTNTYKPTTGDVVVVNGTFKLANYYVTFDTVAMRWNGSAWEGITDLTSIELNDVEFDASDDAFLIETTGTTVNGNNVDAGTVLYEEGEYSIVYTIGTAVMTQKLNIIYKFTSAGNNGAGKSDTTLPTDMVTGNANAADQYITQVQATTHGTTVISMDRENAYKTTADFDDYGLDYVVDINMDSDREFKVLQLADTQTINSEQQRYSGRISPTMAAQTVPEKQFENMQYYIDKVVAESKPDVILIAGDLIYTEFDDDGSMWIDLIEYMDSLQIPWAPIFGNHDQESIMGVEWQCEQMMNSTYCLFNRRHEGVGGNCNYSIGLARNGKLEKAIYMFDSNGCGYVAPSGNTYSTWGYDDNGNMTEVRAASGFYQTQIEWYKKAAMRVNAVAGEIIPSIQCYHIGTEEVLLAARAAGYQYGDEQAGNKYAFLNDQNAETYLANGNVNSIVRPQTGDLGYKMGSFSDAREAKGMLEIMNAVGTTGVFLGHNHSINTSMTYGGVRWTFGLKTGSYVDDTVKKGGTLITMKNDSDSFDIRHIYVELEYSEPSLDADKVAENNASTIYLNGNVVRDAMAASTDALVVSKDAESGIFVNAVKSDATLEKYAEDKYKITLSADANVGDVVAIYGIFDNNAGTHGVYFQKTLAVKWDGTKWIAITLDWLNGSTVSLGTVVVDYSKVASYKLDAGVLPTRVDAEGKKTDAPMKSISAYGESNVKYILDNVTYDKTYVLYIPGDAHVDEDLNVLDLVAMKKAENGEAAQTATESYADALGSAGLRSKLVTPTSEFLVTGIGQRTYINTSSKAWWIYLDYKGYGNTNFDFDMGTVISTSKAEYMSHVQYKLNDGTVTSVFGSQMYEAEDGQILLVIPDSVVKTDGTAKDKLTIVAQTKTSSDRNTSDGTYTYTLKEDFNLYFDGTTVSFVE